MNETEIKNKFKDEMMRYLRTHLSPQKFKQIELEMMGAVQEVVSVLASWAFEERSSLLIERAKGVEKSFKQSVNKKAEEAVDEEFIDDLRGL